MPRTYRKAKARKVRRTATGQVAQYAAVGQLPAAINGFSIAKQKKVYHKTIQICRTNSAATNFGETGAGEKISINLSSPSMLAGVTSPFATDTSVHTDAKRKLEPLGFDVMQDFYSNCTVTRARVKVVRIPTRTEGGTLTATTGASLQKPVIVAGMLSTSRNPLNGTDFETWTDNLGEKKGGLRWLEKNDIKNWAVVRGGASSMDHAAMVFDYDAKKFFNLPVSPHGLDNFRVTTEAGQSPTNHCFFHLFIGKMDKFSGAADDQYQYDFMITIEQEVMYSDPKVLATSATS